MTKFKIMIWLLIGIVYSLPLFAHNIKPIACENAPMFLEVRKQISALDQEFKWNDPGCEIVATKSIFPKKDKSGMMQYKNGLQLFVYQNYQLKFICLPGWVCKLWE